MQKVICLGVQSELLLVPYQYPCAMHAGGRHTSAAMPAAVLCACPCCFCTTKLHAYCLAAARVVTCSLPWWLCQAGPVLSTIARCVWLACQTYRHSLEPAPIESNPRSYLSRWRGLCQAGVSCCAVCSSSWELQLHVLSVRACSAYWSCNMHTNQCRVGQAYPTQSKVCARIVVHAHRA